MSNEQALQLVIETIGAEADDLGYENLHAPTSETALYSGEDGIDSLSLVRIITAIERAAERRFGRRVVLADERAMSMRRSPFRSVASLADLLTERLGTGGA